MNMDNKRAVLWDMDGVLVDSGEQHYQSWLQTLTELSIPFDREKFRQTFGMNNTRILTIQLFRELIQGNLQLLPGVLNWLKHLHKRGILQAVASSAPHKNIEAIMNELDIRGYFSALISAAAMPGKPDPTVFLEAATQLGVKPGQCVVVEDAVAGVEAACQAGMKCIAVSTTHPVSSLSEADKVVDSLEELELNDFLQ
jgi:beta-phosphoglucomutase